MTINSKSDICNLALGNLGNFGTISDIDTPTNDKERTFALWYDVCRQFTLKLMVPNFALNRQYVAAMVATPVFGYGYAYALPTNCLRVLGIGEAWQKRNDYAVEGNLILSDDQFTGGAPIRYVMDVKDVNQFSPEYIMLLAQYIAAYTCLSITQDQAKTDKLMEKLPASMTIASGVNAQENRPIRINHSRYKDSRFAGIPIENNKK